MATGRISETQLKRSVLKELKYNNPSVSLHAGVGVHGVEFNAQKGNIAISNSTYTLRNVSEVKISAFRAVNALLSRGAMPRVATVNIVIPNDYQEEKFKEIFSKYNEVFKEIDTEICYANCEYSKNIEKFPAAFVTVAGDKCEMGFSDIKSGDQVVMTKYTAIEAGYRFYLNNDKALENRFSKSYISGLLRHEKGLSAIPEAAVAMQHGVKAMHDLSEGGIFSGLWELASGAGLGIEARLENIKMAQDIVEMCEFYDVNPYELPATGSLLIVCENGDEMTKALLEKGIEASLIGEITSDNDRALIGLDGNKRFLEKPKSGILEELFEKIQ